MSDPAAIYEVTLDSVASRDPRPAHERAQGIDYCFRCGVVDHHLVGDLCAGCRAALSWPAEAVNNR